MMSVKSISCGLIFGFTLVGGIAAEAACNKATLNGNFAGSIDFEETDFFYGNNGVAMIRFNGTGGIAVKKGVEVGDNFDRSVGNGAGSYSVAPNCTGTARINWKSGGIVVATGRIDFVVGGTKSAPEILGVYVNQDDGSRGNLRFIKSAL